MGSKKNKRGQQRKADKNTRQLVALSRRISKADNDATVDLILSRDELLSNASGEITKLGVDIVSNVLNFLKCCQDETFDEVLASVGGDLFYPSTWVQALIVIAENIKSSRMQIIQTISPLVSCMCNDMERLFFKSNEHWGLGIKRFAQLVVTLIQFEDDEIVHSLLNHDGLLRDIIQWGFWGEYRPDIAKEIEAEDLAHIAKAGRISVYFLLETAVKINDDTDDPFSSTNKSLMQIIGITPIVNKEYDPSCLVSYTAGYIHQMKKGWKGHNIMPLVYLTGNLDYVDKEVIIEMIDYGLNCKDCTCDKAMFWGLISKNVLEDSNKEPNDTRVAFAVRAGIVEMLLNFTHRFGGINFDDDDVKVQLFEYLGSVFHYIHQISLHQKTAKAIRSKKEIIENQLVCLELNTDISGNTNYKKLLDMLRSTLNQSGSYCCRCNKALSKTEVMQCNGCGCMAYCSKACQKEDWLNGHNLTCGISFSDNREGLFQGRLLPGPMPGNERDAAKLDELELNMSMIQLNLFLNNTDTIIKQAKTLDIPLYDCVVLFDLRECPSVVAVTTYTEYFDTYYHHVPEVKEGFEFSRSKENITCVYLSKLYINKEELFTDDEPSELWMQRLFPHKMLTNKKVE